MNEPTWLEILKRLGIGFIVRRLLEIGGGAILTYGISEAELILMVTGIISVLVGAAWSWIQTKWLARAEPEEIKDLKEYR